jgi:hypothetical protein
MLSRCVFVVSGSAATLSRKGKLQKHTYILNFDESRCRLGGEANLLNKPVDAPSINTYPPHHWRVRRACQLSLRASRMHGILFDTQTETLLHSRTLATFAREEEAAFCKRDFAHAGFKSSFHERLLKGANEDYSARPGGTQCNGN